MKKSIFVGVIILNVLACDGWAQGSTSAPVTQTAAISGTVVADATGAKLSGAVVAVYRRAPQTPVYRSQTAADVNGAFTLGSLPAGTYNICAQVPGANYLDPCTWTTSPPSVAVTDGQTASGNTIRLKAGGVLKVRVNDPGQSLAQRPNDPGPGHVFIGLTIPLGAPLAMPMTKNDSTGLEFQMVVPMDTSLTALAYSKEVAFQDPDQNAVPLGGSNRNVIVPSNGPATATVTYTITGRRP